MRKLLCDRRLWTLAFALTLTLLAFLPVAWLSHDGETYAVRAFRPSLPATLRYDERAYQKAVYYQPDTGRMEWVGRVALASFGLMAAAAGLSLRKRGWPEALALCFLLLGALGEAYLLTMLRALPLDAGVDCLVFTPVGWLYAVVALLALWNLYCQRSLVQRMVIYLVCGLLALLALLPFWIMLVNATRSTQQINQGISLLPGPYLAYNWEVLDQFSFDAVTGFLNSLLIAVSSTVLCLYFSALTAYGFAGYQFRGNRLIFTLIVASMMVPGIVGSIGYYQAIYRIGWTDSFWPLILPAIASAGTVFFFRQYLEANYQSEITEAARVDGSGEFQTFNRIILPMMGPVLAISGISSFVGAWNNYFTPLMLISSPSKMTIPLMVQQMTGNDYRTEYGSLYLGLSMASLPLFAVYGVLSRYIVRGVSLGAVKG